jgi:hypothetical protein
MPYTAAGKNLMLNALAGTNPTTPISHTGLLGADAGKSVTGVASTDVFTSTAHGYSNGDVVVLSGLTGGSGLVAGRVYFVIGVTANTFQLALTSGGTAVDFTTDLTAGTVTRIVELSGGSPAYARKAIAFSAAAGGVLDDSTNGAIVDVPASANVDYVGFWSAVTAGTLLAISAVTRETFANQGTYTVTDAKLDLNAVA